MHFGPFCYLQNHYILLNKVSTVQCTGPSGFTIESLIEYLIAANPVLEGYSIWTNAKATRPEHIYNPITAIGFSSMSTPQLDNTKR